MVLAAEHKSNGDGLLALGMSDEQLEAACAPGDMGIAPWVYWTSEHYSLGKCLRQSAGFPRLLPLYVYADHGPGLEASFYPHERSNDARVHLTFHPFKADQNRDQAGKKVLRVAHPWIFYRRSCGLQRLAVTRGTLAFVPHGTPGFQWENHLSDSYFSLLTALPEKYRPVVLCLHMHDINAGVHKRLRRFGLPIVTAGNTNSTLFVDRFYDIARRFSYATSQSWGSQVAYCVELGVPYFFLGERPRLHNLSHTEVALGQVSYHDEYHRQFEDSAERLFRSRVDAVTKEQVSFVATLLGLDSTTTRVQLSWILWAEFFRHWRKWSSTWLKPLCESVRRRGLLGAFRRLRERAKVAGK